MSDLPPFAPWPHFDDDDVQVVSDILRSGKVNQWTGHHVTAFEQEFAAFHDVNHAVAVANGTNAIEVALEALGIGAGDEVVVTPRTFLASASAVIRVGAKPVFADVDRQTGNISAATVEPVLTDRTKAVLCVHLAGWPVDIDPIIDLVRPRGIKVVEDAAQAHGAVYKGRRVGSLADVAAFSFCQDKIITTAGEGGMVLTDDEALYKTMWSIKDHGKDFDAVFHKEHLPGFRWLHGRFGSNYRMTEMQAAVGRNALKHLPSWTKTRQDNAARLDASLQKFDVVRCPQVPSDVEHACYKHYAYVRPERLKEGWSRDRIMNAITALGVPCFSGSCSEIYLEHAFDEGDVRPQAPLPVAHELGATSLLFLVHPTLTEENLQRSCRAIEQVLAEATP